MFALNVCLPHSYLCDALIRWTTFIITFVLLYNIVKKVIIGIISALVIHVWLYLPRTIASSLLALIALNELEIKATTSS